MRCLYAAMCIFSCVGWAQETPLSWPTTGFDAVPITAGVGPTYGTDARTMGAGRFRAGLGVSYERNPLRLVRTTGDSVQQLGEVISHRASMQFFGAWSILDWLEVSLQLPIVIWQKGEDLAEFNLAGIASAGIGSPVMGARFRLLEQDKGAPLTVAMQMLVTLPIGSQSTISGNQLVVQPQVHLARDFDLFHLGLIGGMSFRRIALYGDVTVGHAVEFALTAGVGKKLRGELTGRLHLAFLGSSAADVLAGVRVTGLAFFDVFAAAGPAFGTAPGTPTLRAIVGVAAGNAHRESPAPPAPLPPPKPDVCAGPHAPAEACPLADADGDGVANGADGCPTTPGPMTRKGCPVIDTDKDTVFDEDDGCVTVAGPPSNKGCPFVDTDLDGVTDQLDECKTVPGLPERRGCPLPDRDKDAVADQVDNCPDLAGPASNQGCPAKQKQLVVITNQSLQILDKVFFDTGKATIQRRSFVLLDQIASVLKSHPEIEKVRIEGHTDNQGKPELNRVLSAARSQAVLQYLSLKRVAVERLEAKGFGADKPMATNDTASGRELNRRVEFVIVSGEQR